MLTESKWRFEFIVATTCCVKFVQGLSALTYVVPWQLAGKELAERIREYSQLHGLLADTSPGAVILLWLLYTLTAVASHKPANSVTTLWLTFVSGKALHWRGIMQHSWGVQTLTMLFANSATWDRAALP